MILRILLALSFVTLVFAPNGVAAPASMGVGAVYAEDGCPRSYHLEILVYNSLNAQRPDLHVFSVAIQPATLSPCHQSFSASSEASTISGEWNPETGGCVEDSPTEILCLLNPRSQSTTEGLEMQYDVYFCWADECFVGLVYFPIAVG